MLEIKTSSNYDLGGSNESNAPFDLQSREFVPLLTIDTLVNSNNLNFMFDKPDLVKDMWKIINW